jgi:endonuclease/exonuclease/phosphatase family metal-dependent hydrolase
MAARVACTAAVLHRLTGRAGHSRHAVSANFAARHQVADLLDFIASNSKQAPVVIAGDFNTAADTLDLEALRKGYGDSYGSVHRNSDATVSTLNMHVFDKPARIDHVFFQQNRLLAREARILFDRPYADGRWASDHYGVWVRLQLAPDQLAAP